MMLQLLRVIIGSTGYNIRVINKWIKGKPDCVLVRVLVCVWLVSLPVNFCKWCR